MSSRNGKKLDAKELDAKELDGKDLDVKDLDGKDLDVKDLDVKDLDSIPRLNSYVIPNRFSGQESASPLSVRICFSIEREKVSKANSLTPP